MDNGLTPAEQHLGDRLAALVDGELGDDARERVLSHLATCWGCKVEADAQRRLKNVFADTAPPPPSDGLMARLQGLPADGGSEHGSGPGSGSSAAGTGRAGRGRGEGEPPGPGGSSAVPPFAARRSAGVLDYLPGGRGVSALMPERGFRTHRMPDLERSGSRGRRFAFAAAGAFSLAALALSGAIGPGGVGGSTVAAGERGNPSASPARAANSLAADRTSRRRGAENQRPRSRSIAAPPAPTSTGSARAGAEQPAGRADTVVPLVASTAEFTPSLIRTPSLLTPQNTAQQLSVAATPGRGPVVAAASTPAPAAAPSVTPAGPPRP